MVQWLKKAVKKNDTNKYVKFFKCQDHLFRMVSCCLESCKSLREVADGIRSLSDKEETLKINHLPKKRTLADANSTMRLTYGKVCTLIADKRNDAKINNFITLVGQVKKYNKGDSELGLPKKILVIMQIKMDCFMLISCLIMTLLAVILVRL